MGDGARRACDAFDRLLKVGSFDQREPSYRQVCLQEWAVLDRDAFPSVVAHLHRRSGDAHDRTSGDQLEAQQHYLTTVQMLDDMRKEPGSEKILQRVDLKTMYDDATRWTQA